MVLEADEYDRSFLTLFPDITVITSVDADHLDIYGDPNQLRESFELFLSQLNKNGKSIIKAGLPFEADFSYAVDTVADVYADNIRIVDGAFYFDYVWKEGRIANICLGIPGNHNVENATAAITVARILGIAEEKIVQSLSSFTGVKRRFEYVAVSEETIYIDDYAHHPEELKACFSAARALYPNKHLTVVFQPHLYSRTRDFAGEFATVLSGVDTLLLMDIYPARELPIKGVNSQMLLDRITATDKRLCTADEVLAYVKQHRPELVVTVGAGNIDLLVQPLKAIIDHV